MKKVFIIAGISAVVGVGLYYFYKKSLKKNESVKKENDITSENLTSKDVQDNIEKEMVVSTIKERHNEAAIIIKDTINEIHNNAGSLSQGEVVGDVSRELDDLLSEE